MSNRIVILIVVVFLAMQWGIARAQTVSAIFEQTITGDGIACSYKLNTTAKEISVYCVISSVEIE